MAAGSAPLFTTAIPLTPGPLVVALKDVWPPSQPKNIETIAASCECQVPTPAMPPIARGHAP